MSAREDWILVRSMDELFPGCAVRGLCSWCQRQHVGTITNTVTILSEQAWNTNITCSKRPVFDESDPYMGIGRAAVAAGRICRLGPDEAGDASTGERRTRVLAEVR